MMLKFSPFFSDAAKPSGLGFLPFLVFATFLNSASCFSARGCSSSAMWRAAAPDSPMLLSTNSRSLARGGALRLRLRPRADLPERRPGVRGRTRGRCGGRVVGCYSRKCFWPGPREPGAERREGVEQLKAAKTDLWAGTHRLRSGCGERRGRMRWLCSTHTTAAPPMTRATEHRSLLPSTQLSSSGWREARAVARHFSENHLRGAKELFASPRKFSRNPTPLSIETLRKSAKNPVFSARVSFFCPRLRFFTQDRPFCMARELILATIDD